jgi:3-dehydroquinate synthase
LSFILPVKIGEVAIVRDVTRDEMKAAAEWTLALMHEQGVVATKKAVAKKKTR